MRRERGKEGERESSGYEIPWAACTVGLRDVSTVILPPYESVQGLVLAISRPPR